MKHELVGKRVRDREGNTYIVESVSEHGVANLVPDQNPERTIAKPVHELQVI